MSSDKLLALVHYYSREGYARQVQAVCNEVLKKRSSEAVLIFWRAYGLLLEGSSAEALRELQAIHEAADLELAVSAAMLHAHEAAKIVDNEAVIELQNRLDMEERSATDTAALHLAWFYLFTRSKERARGLVERVLRNQPEYPPALVLLGWILVTQAGEDDGDGLFDASELDEALQHFETVVSDDPSNLEALLGKVKVLEAKRAYGEALQVLTELQVKFSWFVPALVEKGKLLLALGDWEQLAECITTIMAQDPVNVQGLCWQAMVAMIREGNNKQATKILSDIFQAINRSEPKNAELYYRTARPFARLGCTDQAILGQTMLMADRANVLRPDHAPYIVEVAHQRMMLEDYGSATDKFAAATQLDELNLEANCGGLECSILSGGELEEAATQLMFLQEMWASHPTNKGGESPQLLYLKGLIAWKQNKVQEGLGLLERTITRQFELAQDSPLSLELFTIVQPGRITGIVRLLLSSIGGEPRAATEAPSPLISKCNRALDLLSKVAPALLESQLLHARTLYLNGSLEQAQRKAADILRANPEEYSAHLLICSVFVHQNQPALAMSALDQAVSSNFAVRETPLYHIVNAKVLLASGKVEDSKRVLETAMNLPGVRSPLTAQQRTRAGRRIAEPSLHERATIFLLLADVLSRLSKLPDAPEAKKYITDAIREFEGTSEEVRVTVADCELTIARGDVEGALKKLRRIPATSPHYTKARMAMADIYLKHRKDKASYIKCYIELVDKAQDFDAYVMLGESFMQIQEPEKAVRAFESALEFSPRDAELTSKVARALVTTHDYQRAIDFYNKAIRNTPGNVTMQLELALLMIRLRQWPQANAVLAKVLERQKDTPPGNVDNLMLDVEAWALMAKIFKGTSDVESYVSSQTRALDTQKQLLSKLRGELPETLSLQRDKAAEICYELAEHYLGQRKFDRAAELYNEALRHCDSHRRSMLALAKLHLDNGDTDACQQQCVTLLKHDPDNEEASIMLAELMFHKEHYDTAIYHFQQLLERLPHHYSALANLILLLRRAGRLEDVPRYLALAEAASPKAVMDPGYHYCQALLNRYTNKPRDALSEFNKARKDSKWGSQAILHMVEIYLNPDNDAVWQEKDAAGTAETREAVATARSLLQQVRSQDTASQRYRVLECYAIMASKDPRDVDAAVSRLLDMAGQDPNNVPVLLAMATGFMMLDQTPKARNQLKRIQKVGYKPDESEEFERAWLLLADIHISGGKYDLASELCQKCLKYNKSCAKAWEMMGAIMEREQAYKDAAEHYENAWKHENQSSAQVGYKLAFNYLKAKRFVEAIDVCHKVVKAFPEYPKIKKDILEKARMGLKP